jgi:hypothetical protein
MEEEKSDFTCPVGNDNVSLSVMIGEGQLGATIVFRHNVVLVKGGVVIGNLNLGPGSGLVGDQISVESLVNDISSQTNRMSVRYLLRGSGTDCAFLARHVVATDGEMCRFMTTITFA